jgi:hypothetical protein
MTALRRAARLDDQVVASLVLGVAGLFFFNLLFGPLAIGLGAFAAHRHRTEPRRPARHDRADQGVADESGRSRTDQGRVDRGAADKGRSCADQGVADESSRSRARQGCAGDGRAAERNRIAAYAGIALGVADLVVLAVLVTTRLSDGAYISI